MRRASAYAGVLVATLALAPSAFAHAELFPNEIPSGDGYLLNLTVPNEKETASTTRDPDHDARPTSISSTSLPSPAGPPTVSGQKMVDGEMQGGNSITWKGKLSGTALAVLPFTGVPKNAQRVRLHRAPDLLGRQRRRVVRRRELGHARRAHRGHGRGRAARAAAPTHSQDDRASSRSSSAASGCSSAAPRSSRGGVRA